MDKKNKIITVAVVAIIAVAAIGASALNKNDSSMNDMDMSSSEMSQMSQDTSSTDMMMSTSGNQVTYKGFAVVQKTLKVKKGTTVTWTNEDNAKHDVTPDMETADFKTSELFGKGETYSVTFNTVGTYSYLCSPHPYMKGTIEVTE